MELQPITGMYVHSVVSLNHLGAYMVVINFKGCMSYFFISYLNPDSLPLSSGMRTFSTPVFNALIATVLAEMICVMNSVEVHYT